MRWKLAVAIALSMSSTLVLACEEDSTGGSSGTSGSGGPSSSSSSSGSSGSSGTVPTAGTGGAFCDQTLGVVVSALEQCCTAADKETSDYDFTHGVAAALLPHCREALEGSITKARVLFVSDKADACYAAYRATYAPGRCSNITQTYADPAGTSCREAFVGLGADAAPCMGNQECKDGLTCVGYTKQTDGVCRPPQPIGQPCGPARSDGGGVAPASLEFGAHPACASGARCDPLSRTCVAAGVEGASCTSKESCSEPLVCKLGKCTSEALSDENGPCLEGDDCKPAFYCAGASGGAQGRCAPKKPAGGSCTGAMFVSECVGRCDAPFGQPGTCASFCGSP